MVAESYHGSAAYVSLAWLIKITFFPIDKSLAVDVSILGRSEGI